ncbi:MAG: transcriptional regulator, AraC family [Clostridia bacterium]|nr:transcriptional regulator, AraC family [Clostridia bacterium]
MENNSNYYLIASKILSKIKIPEHGDKYTINVNWLRYIGNENTSSIYQKSHSHTGFELHCIIKGNCSYKFNDEILNLQNGELLLIKKGIIHSEVYRSDEFGKFAILFELYDDHSDSENTFITKAMQGKQYIKGFQTKLITYMFELSMNEAIEQKSGYLHVIRNCVMLIVLDASRQIYYSDELLEPHQMLYENDSRIKNIEKFILDNIKHKLTSEVIASHIRFSTKQLNRIVKKEYNKSVKQLIDFIKCNYSKKLLLETDMNLSTISEEIGFTNEYSFNRFFKRIEGMTPGLFRISKYK